jgi:manganese oxidase
MGLRNLLQRGEGTQMFVLHGVVTLLMAGAIAQGTPVAAGAQEKLQDVLANDNRRAAGLLENGTLTLNLRAARGLWRPEGEAGPAIPIEAFGEDGDALRAPAPLIRVPHGTQIVARVRNELDAPLRVFGFCAREGKACPPVELSPGATREICFDANRAGTYYYWATSTGMPLEFRAAGDTQLSGAFVVDPAGGPALHDRILVITDWTSLTKQQLRDLAKEDDIGVAFFKLNPKFGAMMNGLSWPATERLTYQLGETVRWRVLNLSTQLHPMHLHGFYFDVDSRGDNTRETIFNAGEKPRVVTELMMPGSTMTMTWRPERAGNWLFHCHRMQHVAPERRLAEGGDPHAGHHAGHDAAAGMAGMVMGITVVGPESTPGPANITPRKLTLVMDSEANRYGDKPAYGFALGEGEIPPVPKNLTAPGPIIVLRRGEPAEITLVNRMTESTAIHWHGIELDSYYDGVHGWSGVGAQVTPIIEPGGRFVVRLTPPRTGTFIYHTHLHDDQLASGLYGALVVLDPGETFDPDLDHVIVMGRRGPGESAPAVLNGEINPRASWKAGARHRIRLVNITPDDVFVVSLSAGDGPVTWTPLTKDGAPVPSTQQDARPARQTISVGETYDFVYDAPPGRKTLWLDVKSPAGKWQVQGQVTVK